MDPGRFLSKMNLLAGEACKQRMATPILPWFSTQGSGVGAEEFSITILLPPSRPNSKAITRFGFIEEGQLTIDDETFVKFRLSKA